MIGSTDTHTSLSTADEEDFFGKVSMHEANATRAVHPYMENPKLGLKIMGLEQTAYDAKYYKLKGLDPTIPMVTQERAYTLPIRYTP